MFSFLLSAGDFKNKPTIKEPIAAIICVIIWSKPQFAASGKGPSLGIERDRPKKELRQLKKNYRGQYEPLHPCRLR